MRAVAQVVAAAVGKTQASSVMAVVRLREALWGTVTKLLPLKTRAPPFLPCGVHVTPAPRVPALLLPEESRTVEPLPSLEPMYCRHHASDATDAARHTSMSVDSTVKKIDRPGDSRLLVGVLVALY